MAQKRNPMLSENLCGLARVVRGFLGPAYEDMVLWHERDLTNSSAERFIIPHMFVLTDDILVKMEQVFKGLKVDRRRMLANLRSSKGMVMSEAVMLALVSKGLGRQDAHELVRKASLEAERKGLGLREALRGSKAVAAVMTAQELDQVMDYSSYLGSAPEMVDRTVANAGKAIARK